MAKEIKPQATTTESLLLMHQLCKEISYEFFYFGGFDMHAKAKGELAYMMENIFLQWAQENELENGK